MHALLFRGDSSTPTSSVHTDSVTYALLSSNNSTHLAPPQVVLNGLNGALRIAQESSEVSKAKLWSALMQVAAFPVGLEVDLMCVTEADARTALARVGKSRYLNDDVQPGHISPLLVKCMNQMTTKVQATGNERMDSEQQQECDGRRLINCQRLVDVSTTKERAEVMASILNVTLARDRLKCQGYRSLKQKTSAAVAVPPSGLGLTTRALKRKVKVASIKNGKRVIHLPSQQRESNNAAICNSTGGGEDPRDAIHLRHELMAAEDSVVHFTLAVRSDLAWVKSNSEVESGKVKAVPSLNLQVKRRCQKWEAEKMIGALHNALIRIKQPYFSSWRSKVTISALTDLSIRYIRFRGANIIEKLLVKWEDKRSKETLQRWGGTCKLIKRQEENRAALEMARCVRGFLGRCKSRSLKQLRAAATLQMSIRRWLALK